MITYGDGGDPNEKKEDEEITYKYFPLVITVTPNVEELLKSNEAKFYLKEIKSGANKLKAFLSRECRGVTIEQEVRLHREKET